jgi:hypothetical protein
MRTASLLSLALLVGTAPARADAPPPWPQASMQLDFTRGAGVQGCPDERALRGFLAREFGYDPVTRDAGMRVQIVVARLQGVELLAVFTIEDSAGKIVWAQPIRDRFGCRDLLESVAVAIQVTVDHILLKPPAVPKAPAPPPPEPAAPLPPEPAAPPTPPPVPAPAAPPPAPPCLPKPQPWTFRAGAGYSLNFGFTPGPDLGPLAFFTGKKGAYSLSGEVRAAWTPNPMDEVPGKLVVFTRFIGGAIAPCIRRDPFFTCIPLTLGILSVSSEAGHAVSLRQPVVFAIGWRLGVEQSFMKGFAVRAFMEPASIVTKTMLELDRSEVWASPLVSLSVGVALAVSLGPVVDGAHR